MFSVATLAAIAIIVILIFCILGWFISTSNRLTATRLRVDQAFSGIDVWLQNRYNVLTKMVDTLRDYTAYESATMQQLVALRSQQRRPGDVAGIEATEGQMRAVERELFAQFEAYPQLRAGELFLNLQRSIRECEDNLQAAHRAYNASATTYNTAIAMFPASIVAGMKGAAPFQLFQAEAHARADVNVRL